MSLVTRSAALRDGLRGKEGIVILLTRHLPLARFARLGPYRAIFSRAWRRCKAALQVRWQHLRFMRH
jgi:hypothetical protein